MLFWNANFPVLAKASSVLSALRSLVYVGLDAVAECMGVGEA